MRLDLAPLHKNKQRLLTITLLYLNVILTLLKKSITLNTVELNLDASEFSKKKRVSV